MSCTIAGRGRWGRDDQDGGARAYGLASVMKVADAESGMVYRGLELLYLTITLCVARSFTGKPKGSNPIEQELSMVKRRTKRRHWTRSGATKTSLR
jgi:hypothetical protein